MTLAQDRVDSQDRQDDADVGGGDGGETGDSDDRAKKDHHPLTEAGAPTNWPLHILDVLGSWMEPKLMFTLSIQKDTGKGVGIHTRNLWKKGWGCHSVFSISGLGMMARMGQCLWGSSPEQRLPVYLEHLHEHQGQSLASPVPQHGGDESGPSFELLLALHKSYKRVPSCARAGGNSDLCDRRYLPLVWAELCQTPSSG